jgi:hypothetical protein
LSRKSRLPQPSPRIEAPVIIIGSGRSGSSLLNEILNAHPDIVMFGELNFMVPRAWDAFVEVFSSARPWNLLTHLNADRASVAHIEPSPIDLSAVLKILEGEEWQRRGAVLRRTIADLFCLHEKRAKIWGFKEIWNGNAFHHDWAIYDAVFPNAQWLHIVRNPVEYLRATAWHTRQSYSEKDVVGVLEGWLKVFAMSRLRVATGRYSEIRYEDLVRKPQQVLAPIIERIGLEWHDACMRPLDRPIGTKSGKVRLPALSRALFQNIPGLSEVLEEFDYPGEYARTDGASSEPAPPYLLPLEGGRFRLCGEIRREEGFGWTFNLGATDQASVLSLIADGVDFWQRSTLRLFENDRPLAPSHSLHFMIRQTGGGAYSHWEGHLLFSTSDNSDPNQNGRIYSFDLGSADGGRHRQGPR